MAAFVGIVLYVLSVSRIALAHHCTTSGALSSPYPSWCSEHNPLSGLPVSGLTNREGVPFRCLGVSYDSECLFVVSSLTATLTNDTDVLFLLTVENAIEVSFLSNPSNIIHTYSFASTPYSWNAFSDWSIAPHLSNSTRPDVVSLILFFGDGVSVSSLFLTFNFDLSISSISSVCANSSPTTPLLQLISNLLFTSSLPGSSTLSVWGQSGSSPTTTFYGMFWTLEVSDAGSGYCTQVASSPELWTVESPTSELRGVSSISHGIGLNHSDTSSLRILDTITKEDQVLILLHNGQKALILPYIAAQDVSLNFDDSSTWSPATFYQSTSPTGLTHVQLLSRSLRRIERNDSSCSYFSEPESQSIWLVVLDSALGANVVAAVELSEFEELTTKSTNVTNVANRSVICPFNTVWSTEFVSCIPRRVALSSIPQSQFDRIRGVSFFSSLEFSEKSSGSGRDGRVSLLSLCSFVGMFERKGESSFEKSVREVCEDDGLRSTLSSSSSCELELVLGKVTDGSSLKDLRQFSLENFLHELIIIEGETDITGTNSRPFLASFSLYQTYNHSSLNFNNDPSLEFLRVTELSSRPLSVDLSANGLHQFIAVKRPVWQISSIRRIQAICELYYSEFESFFAEAERYGVPIESMSSAELYSFCVDEGRRESVRLIRKDDFMQFRSACAGLDNVFCPSVGPSSIIQVASVGSYLDTPINELECEAGTYCVAGEKIYCPKGSICPTSGLSKPVACSLDPYGATTCGNLRMTAVSSCSIGYLCPFAYETLPVSPGLKQIGLDNVTECSLGEWCSVRSVGTLNETLDSHLLCPPGRFCEKPDVTLPEECLFTPPETFFVYSSDRGYSEYCPAGTYEVHPPCPTGSFCVGPLSIETCQDGFFCPNGTFFQTACPANHYCQTPAEIELCPSSHYCPQGVSTPRLSLSLLCLEPGSCWNDLFSTFHIAILVVFFILWVIYYFVDLWCYKRYLESKKRNEQIGGIWNKQIKGSTTLRADLSFSDLRSVANSNQRVILNGVSGMFRSGSSVAIMGPSGCGKSTLLKSLAGEAFYARVSGAIMVNGEEMTLDEFSHLVGFAPQDDSMMPGLTVEETLYFSSKTRLKMKDGKKRLELVETVIRLLNLGIVRHNLVSALSGGQRKRVSFGMELVSDPLIFLADEPTSGLDAATALDISRILHRVAKIGTTVICVIHQPRYDIFSSFDELFLMASCGGIAYQGPVSEVGEYFAKLGFPCPPNVNQADFLIDCISNRVECTVNERTWAPDEFVEKWEASEEFKALYKSVGEDNVEDAPLRAERNQQIHQESADRQVNCFGQFVACLRREYKRFVRRIPKLLIAFLLVACAGLLCGIIFTTKEDLYSSITNTWMSSAVTSLSLFIFAMSHGGEVYGATFEEIFFREKRRGMSPIAQFLSIQVVEVVYLFSLPFVFMTSIYFTMQPISRFWVLYCCGLALTLPALGAAYVVGLIFKSNSKMAAAVFIVITLIFSGLGGTYEQMKEWDPPLQWMPYIMFPFYSMSVLFVEAIFTREVHHAPQMRKFLGDGYGYEGRDPWYYLLFVPFAIGMIFRIIAYLLYVLTSPDSILNRWFANVKHFFKTLFEKDAITQCLKIFRLPESLAGMAVSEFELSGQQFASRGDRRSSRRSSVSLGLHLQALAQVIKAYSHEYRCWVQVKTDECQRWVEGTLRLSLLHIDAFIARSDDDDDDDDNCDDDDEDPNLAHRVEFASIEDYSIKSYESPSPDESLPDPSAIPLHCLHIDFDPAMSILANAITEPGELQILIQESDSGSLRKRIEDNFDVDSSTNFSNFSLRDLAMARSPRTPRTPREARPPTPPRSFKPHPHLNVVPSLELDSFGTEDSDVIVGVEEEDGIDVAVQGVEVRVKANE